MFAKELGAIRMSVTIDGTEHELKVKPGDLVAFEQHFGRSLFEMRDKNGDIIDPALAEAKPELVASGVGLTEVTFLAWRAARRADLFDGDLEAWLDFFDDLDFGEATEAKPDPT